MAVSHLTKHEVICLSIFGSVSALVVILQFLGQNLTSAVNAGFLIRLTPLFVVPLTYILLKEPISYLGGASMVIMIGGAFLLTTNGRPVVPKSGDLVLLFVAFLVGFQNVFAKRIMNHTTTRMVIMFRVVLSGLLVMLVIPVAIGSQGFGRFCFSIRSMLF